MVIVTLILKITIILWVVLMILMLPVYFVRKRCNPNSQSNTFKLLIVKSFIVSFIFVLIICSGLIVMNIDELKGIYR